MKKIFPVLSLVAIFIFLIATAASAKNNGNPEGEIISIDQTGGTLTILTTEGEELTVILPKNFDYQSVEVGMIVVVKGNWKSEGFLAQWVRPVEDEDTEDTDTGEGNAWGEGGVYCAGGKENTHPVAAKIAETYDVDPAWVMEQACSGHGFGAVMLALQTAAANGGDPEELLNQRKEGKGWGQIWKEAGLIGNDKSDNPPPGWLKKPDKHTGPPEGKKP